MKNKKTLHTYSSKGYGDVKTFEYLEHAIKHATKQALKWNTEWTVAIDLLDKKGVSIKSLATVAIIRGSKFNKYGKIK